MTDFGVCVCVCVCVCRSVCVGRGVSEKCGYEYVYVDVIGGELLAGAHLGVRPPTVSPFSPPLFVCWALPKVGHHAFQQSPSPLRLVMDLTTIIS